MNTTQKIMRHEIQRICPASLGKILSAIYFLTGCLLTVSGLLLSRFGEAQNWKAHGPINFLPLHGAGIIQALLYLVFLALSGMISGFVIAWLYNGVSRLIGGVEVSLRESSPLQSPKPTPAANDSSQ